MKEAYSKPVVEIQQFQVTDVITTSVEIVDGESD